MASEASKVAELSNNLDSILNNLQKAGKLDIISVEDIKRMKSLDSLSQKVSKSLISGGAKQYKTLSANLEEISSRIGGLQQEQMKYVKIYNKAIQSGNQNMIRLAEKRLKMANKEMKEKQKQIAIEERAYEKEYQRLKELKKEFDYASSNFEGVLFLDPSMNIKNVDKVSEYAEGRLADVADTFGDVMGSSFDSIANRSINLTKGVGKRLRVLGSQIQAKEGGGYGKIAGTLTKLGKSLAILGGIAGGLFAVGKALQAVEEAQKGANKELLDAVGGTDLMVDGTNNLYDAVNKLRKDLADGSFANEMGMTLDEVRGLVGELHNVNITMRSIGGNTSALKDIMKTFQAQSKSLGISFGEVAEYSTNMRMEMGYVASDASFLERMADQFSTIRDLALQSGYNTNKFFQTIKTLTDGVDHMNYRVGQAGKLFLSLSKVLGPKAAEAFAQGLSGGFKGEGIVDRYKRIILTGGGRTKKILKNVADNASASFMKRFQGMGEFDNEKEMQILKKYGIEAGGNRKDFIKALASKSDIERQEILGELQSTGDRGKGIARELYRLFDLSKGAEKGGLSNMALALSQVDMSGSMQMQMSQINAFLGEKGFAGASATMIEAVANYTGKSMEELENMRQIDFMMRGQLKQATKIQQMNISETEKNQKLQEAGLKNIKVVDGKLVSSETGEEITDMNGYMKAQGDNLKKMQADTTTQNQLLRDGVDATLTSAQMINNHLGSIMQNATDYLGQMLRYQTKDDPVQQAIQSTTEEYNRRIKDKQDRILSTRQKNQKEITKLESKKEGVSDPRRLKAINEKIAKIKAKEKEEIDRMQMSISKTQKAKSYLQTSEGQKLMEYGVDAKSGDFNVDKNLFEASLGKASVKQLMGKHGMTKGQAKMLKARSEMRLRGGGMRTSEQLDADIKDIERSGSLATSEYEHRHKNMDILAKHGIKRKTSGTLRTGETASLVSGDEVISSSDLKGKHRGYGLREVSSAKSKSKEEIAEMNAKPIKDEISKLTDEMNKLDPKNEKKRAELQAQIQSKSKDLEKFYTKAQVKALEEVERKKAEGAVKSILGKPKLDLSSKYNRLHAQKKLREKLSGMTPGDSEYSTVESALSQLKSSEIFYPEDARSSPNSSRPMLYRRGTLTIGKPYDQVDMYDPNMAKAGGGGVVNVNIYGGDEKKIFDTVKRALKTANVMTQ